MYSSVVMRRPQRLQVTPSAWPMKTWLQFSMLSSNLFPVAPSGAAGPVDKRPHICLGGFHFLFGVGGVQSGGFQGGGLPLCVADAALQTSLLLAFGIPGVILRLVRDFSTNFAKPRNKHIRRDVPAVDAVQPRRFPVAGGADGDDLNAVAVQIFHIAAAVIAGNHFALPRVAQGAGGGIYRHP